MTNAVLITGADGYLGRILTKKFLQSSKSELLLVIRSDSPEEFETKKKSFESMLSGYQDRVRLIEGNLKNEKLFDNVNPGEVETIIHTAAITRFNVEEETANLVNNRGAERVYRWATRCKNLKTFAYTSTLYSTGLHSGRIDERPADGSAGFGNFYEQSKWNAEVRLMTTFNELPWQVFRVSTVMADDASGHVTQYNAFHNTMKLLFYGLISIVPGNEKTPLYFVTGEAVAESLFDVIRSRVERKIFNIAPSIDETIRLGELIDITYEIFKTDEDFKARRIMKPLFVDEQAFELLASGVKGLSGDIVNQAMQSISPFARQLFLNKEVNNDELKKAWPTYSKFMPSTLDLLRQTVRFLLSTRWGRTVSEMKDLKEKVVG